MRTTLELMRLLDFLSRSPKTDAWVVALYPTTEAALEAGMVLAALAGMFHSRVVQHNSHGAVSPWLPPRTLSLFQRRCSSALPFWDGRGKGRGRGWHSGEAVPHIR